MKQTIKSNFDQLPLEILIEMPKEKNKGIVQISHGMAEHKERYIPFMKFLANHGYIAVIHDHRGHGKSIKSPQDKGYFYDQKGNAIVEDLHQITMWLKKQYPDQKIILFGHSMGSLVVRKYIQKYDQEIEKLIVCGSPSKNEIINFALLFVKIEKIVHGDHYRSPFIQKLAFGSYDAKMPEKQENSWICKDQNVVTEYNQDEDCGFIFTLNGFQNLFTLMKEVYQKKRYHVKKKDLPILFLAGEDDPVIGNEKKWLESQSFLKEVGYFQISKYLYQNMRHEILNETEKETVYQDILKWIEK